MATIQEIGQWLATDPNAAKHYYQVRGQQSPQVQHQMDTIVKNYQFARLDGGKVAPFAEPITTDEICKGYGLDPKVSERVFQQLVDTNLTHDLCVRMGTDADRPVPEPTLRDNVEAALNAHTFDSE